MSLKYYQILLIITKTWKQPKCTSIDEQIKNCIYTIEYYLVIKINDLLSHKKTWEKLKCVFLGEISQSEKVIHCIILTI